MSMYTKLYNISEAQGSGSTIKGYIASRVLREISYPDERVRTLHVDPVDLPADVLEDLDVQADELFQDLVEVSIRTCEITGVTFRPEVHAFFGTYADEINILIAEYEKSKGAIAFEGNDIRIHLAKLAFQMVSFEMLRELT